MRQVVKLLIASVAVSLFLVMVVPKQAEARRGHYRGRAYHGYYGPSYAYRPVYPRYHAYRPYYARPYYARPYYARPYYGGPSFYFGYGYW